MMLRIGEFARRGRVSVKALRHYEAIGLLRPAHVDAATGYRSYETDQLDDLHRLMVLRALGLSLKRIRQVLQDDPSPERMRRLLDERRAAVARRIDAEQAQLAAIEARIRHLEGDRDTAPAAVVRDVPAAFVASLRRVVAEYGMVDVLFDEIARALPDTARIAGHGAVWHHCAPHRRQIDCEALVVLERPVSARKVKLYQLPACRAACVVHPSDDEDFASARAAAKAAVANQPLEIKGPMRERYFSSAGDSRFDLTEIQFPLRNTGVLP
ncbi:MAG TPA: helix-turn-helix domain-containing protein [Reyranella sp.]|jgi:DNA-binding transcriptional MerR regulator|nr:helix-turn-helix domain-containing protein [Reyranella sp.]